MEEKLRPGVFSSYTAGSSGYGSGSRAAGLIVPALPYLLSFAAGAMLYVVVEELIPEANLTEGGHTGTLGVMAGFLIMMILDVALG